MTDEKPIDIDNIEEDDRFEEVDGEIVDTLNDIIEMAVGAQSMIAEHFHEEDPEFVKEHCTLENIFDVDITRVKVKIKKDKYDQAKALYTKFDTTLCFVIDYGIETIGKLEWEKVHHINGILTNHGRDEIEVLEDIHRTMDVKVKVLALLLSKKLKEKKKKAAKAAAKRRMQDKKYNPSMYG